MRLRSVPVWLLVVGPNFHGCLAANSRSSAVRPRQSSVERLESIPRGGGGGGIGGVAVSLDPKTVATAGLSCLAAHCAFDIVAPSKSVEFYGLDKYEKINAFYVSRIGGWGLAVLGSLLLQLYTNIPFIKAIGYSFLPITTLTIIQLLSGTYEQSGVNPNSGIAAVVFQDIHFLVCFLGTKLPPIVTKVWIPLYMALSGLSGLNLIISAQTIPRISKSTITILRKLGTITLCLAATVLSQDYLALDPLKALGVGLGTLAVASIPVVFDLNAAARKSSKSYQKYLFFVVLELISAVYLLR